MTCASAVSRSTPSRNSSREGRGAAPRLERCHHPSPGVAWYREPRNPRKARSRASGPRNPTAETDRELAESDRTEPSVPGLRDHQATAKGHGIRVLPYLAIVLSCEDFTRSRLPGVGLRGMRRKIRRRRKRLPRSKGFLLRPDHAGKAGRMMAGIGRGRRNRLVQTKRIDPCRSVHPWLITRGASRERVTTRAQGRWIGPLCSRSTCIWLRRSRAQRSCAGSGSRSQQRLQLTVELPAAGIH